MGENGNSVKYISANIEQYSHDKMQRFLSGGMANDYNNEDIYMQSLLSLSSHHG